MNKYLPLAEHLAGLEQNEVRLSFSDIERIIGSTLPKSALGHDAWWANSKSKDSHTWAHLWLRAGWERVDHSRPQQWVVFRRTEHYQLSDPKVQEGGAVAGQIAPTIEHYQLNDPKAQEGYEYDAKVILRTRNTALALERKIKDNYTCQACGFRLQLGGSYVIEVHHVEPLSATGERETKIEMLVSLCPTCHRIAHLRSTPYSVEEIKGIRGD